MDRKKKVIVTTTIHKYNEVIENYDNMDGWDLVVVGDLKTPKDYRLKNGLYLSPEDQVKIDNALSDLIGWNSIQRRNFGFIEAYKTGADIVATIDDDNFPYPDWDKDIHIGKETESTGIFTNGGVFDPLVAVEGKEDYWHRGFPIQDLDKRKIVSRKKDTIVPDIQANLWNGDLDVDAYERVLFEDCFESSLKGKDFPYHADNSFQFSVFNSQNTMISSQYLPYYFMFPFIGRMDDIWASYYVQTKGAKVIYDKPTVRQNRNQQSLEQNLKDEFLGYCNTKRFVRNLFNKGERALEQMLPQRSYKAFKRYQEHFE